jgi:signal transduction histidine kinase/CheY-like chemotaxis protein
MGESTSAFDHTPQELAANLRQLRQSTLQRLILSSAGLYLLMQLVLSATWPTIFGWPIVPVISVVAISTGFAYLLLNQHPSIAQLVWQSGQSFSACLAALVFQRPEPLLVLAFQPFFAVVTIGWRTGAVIWLLLTFGAVYFFNTNAIEEFNQAYALVIIFTGAFGAVLGWASISSLVTLIQWLSDADQRSHRNLEDARQHRAKLLQVVKELDQANYRLVRINAALAIARQTAEEALRSKAEFVANVSHELRTPLNLIIGFSEVMILSPESYGGQRLPDAYRADINAIYSNAKHLAALVDDVLDLGRIEASKLTLHRQLVSVPELLNEVHDMISDYIAAKGLTFEQHIAPDLPHLSIDKVRIRQVLLNLLVNAVRFTDAGFVRLQVEQAGPAVRFSIADSGKGIAADKLPNIFEPFHTSATESSVRWLEGKGLGLTISKKYIELHSGEIGVESTPGRGSTFWFTLPIETPPQSAHAPAPPVFAEPHRMAERLLVVHLRSPALTQSLQRDLASYRLEFVDDPACIVQAAEELGAVAILTDVPDLLDTGAASIGCPPTVPIIAFPGVEISVESPFIDALLTKPVTPEQLLSLYDHLPMRAQRVLIADENPDVVRLLRRILRARVPATSLLEAYNGEEAIQRLRDDAPDLALIDLTLCDATGQPIAESLSETPARIGCHVVALAPTPALCWRTVTVHCPATLTQPSITRLLHALCGALPDAATAMAPAQQAVLLD